MRRRGVALAIGLTLVALCVSGVTQGLGASPQAPSTAPSEPPVPAAGARVTALQLQDARQTALQVAADAGDDAPTMQIAGKTYTYGQAEEIVSASPGESTVQGIDPRTSKPLAETSVYVVSMIGHFAISRHVPVDQPIPTGTQLRLLIDVASGVVVTTALSNVSRSLPEAINPVAAEAGNS
jgi:hypothetical protein